MVRTPTLPSEEAISVNLFRGSVRRHSTGSDWPAQERSADLEHLSFSDKKTVTLSGSLPKDSRELCCTKQK